MSGIINDFSNSMKESGLLTPLIRTADANSVAADMQQYGRVAFLNYIGITSDTLSASIKVELEMQESDDNSTFTACPDDKVKNTVVGTNTGTVAVIDANSKDDVVVWAEYTGGKRYVRMTHNFTGTHTNGIETSVIGLQSNPSEMPA